MKHTKEPRTTGKGVVTIRSAEPGPHSFIAATRIAGGYLHKPDEVCAANATRIVECVNALAGMNPQAVADAVKFIEELLAANVALPMGFLEQGRQALRNLKPETK